MKQQRRMILCRVFLAFSMASMCLADEQPESAPADGEKRPELSTYPAAAATIENILNTAVQNIARRYNLNESQTRYTDEMMKTEVHKFLLEHENVVWPVIRDLLSTQVIGKAPDDDAKMKSIGKVTRPLAELAKEAILRSNAQWREILTDEQKKVHDFDLSEMEKQFERIDANLESWEQGKRTEDSIFGSNKRVVEGSPPRPPKPPEKELRESPVEESLKITTLFDTFAEEFIKEYDLSESQIDTARSILKEFKAKANDFKNTKKHEFAELASEQKQAIEARDRGKLKEVEAKRKTLLEPVYTLFGEMEGRLKGLLTSAQLERSAANVPSSEPGAAPASAKVHRESKDTGAAKKVSDSIKPEAKGESASDKSSATRTRDDS